MFSKKLNKKQKIDRLLLIKDFQVDFLENLKVLSQERFVVFDIMQKFFSLNHKKKISFKNFQNLEKILKKSLANKKIASKIGLKVINAYFRKFSNMYKKK